MKTKSGSQRMLNVLYVLSWIIFIGICIEAGVLICSAILTFTLSPEVAEHIWKEVDLSVLYRYNSEHFLVEMILISIVSVLKAWLFYLIVKLLHDKKLNLSQPFNREVGRFISMLSYLSLGIGLFSFWGVKYSMWLTLRGVNMPDAASLRLGGSDVWLFMGVILLVIAQVFRRGIEIQTENELTV